MKLFKCPFSKNNASANVVDGKLILSFPNALTPVIWQMDLSEVKASALQVIENTDKDDGAKQFSLTLKTPKGESLVAASFDKKETAVSGLMAASHALANAHGRIRSHAGGSQNANAAPYPAPKKRIGKWIGAIAALLLLLFIFSLWSAQAPRTIGAPQTSAAQQTSQTTNPSSSSGVPVSADDFLSGR